MRRLSFPLLLLTTASVAAPAHATPAALTAMALDFKVLCCTAPPGWHRLGGNQLETMRGGFTTASGLAMTLGIERQVTINGELVARTNFQIADVSKISADEARHAHDALNSARLVQNGANNFVASDIAAGRGTFVQNSLNNQSIATQTIISSSVNSMSMLKDLNFQDGLRDAAIRAIGTH